MQGVLAVDGDDMNPQIQTWFTFQSIAAGFAAPPWAITALNAFLDSRGDDNGASSPEAKPCEDAPRATGAVERALALLPGAHAKCFRAVRGMPAALLEALEPVGRQGPGIGSLLTWDSFASATEDWKWALHALGDGPGVVFQVRRALRGRRVSCYSAVHAGGVDFQEVLFPPGAVFAVAAFERLARAGDRLPLRVDEARRAARVLVILDEVEG
jgi:hypothetical protein